MGAKFTGNKRQGMSDTYSPDANWIPLNHRIYIRIDSDGMPDSFCDKKGRATGSTMSDYGLNLYDIVSVTVNERGEIVTVVKDEFSAVTYLYRKI